MKKCCLHHVFHNKKFSSYWLSLSIILALLLHSTLALSQEDIKARVFQRVTDLLNEAKAEQADLLSPTTYTKAVQEYDQAAKDFDRGKNVQKKIGEVKTLLESAVENAKLAKITLPHLLQAREDALEANATEFARTAYEKAEMLFYETTMTLEKGALDKAKEKALATEKLYREAELLAIKASIIGNARLRLQQSQEQNVNKFAPITFKNAELLLAEAEKILTSDRSAKSQARQKAEAAAYEIEHAIYLSRVIQTLRKDEANWEKLILQNEKYLSQIIAQLGFTPEFNDGFERPVKTAIDAIINLQKEKQKLANEISNQDQTIESLNGTIMNLKAELDKTKEQEAGLKARLAVEQQKRERFQKIESLFDSEEAAVFREGDQIRIRLLQLNFPKGKAVIEPEYFQLLTKLQRVIRLLDEFHVVIEGHTDNIGDDRVNQSLSLQRAKAVKSYLMANMALTDEQISAIGYGESKPIASNDTEAGRAQNRRIDVLFTPNP
ncbi:MAG: OmpA family protein [candidate division KSB1 bacterium]|nr:OmpA family protein [candidate division KSB1 bacterium]MDZ7339893.1 OmpA family protein [candidate division KSB1 bacterium]